MHATPIIEQKNPHFQKMHVQAIWYEANREDMNTKW
jgi:hypothetical protein